MTKVWHSADIKAEISKRGETLSGLARANGKSSACVRNALITPSKSGEKIIAKFLQLPLHELWPDRWTEDGQRIYPRYDYLHAEVGS